MDRELTQELFKDPTVQGFSEPSPSSPSSVDRLRHVVSQKVDIYNDCSVERSIDSAISDHFAGSGGEITEPDDYTILLAQLDGLDRAWGD